MDLTDLIIDPFIMRIWHVESLKGIPSRTTIAVEVLPEKEYLDTNVFMQDVTVSLNNGGYIEKMK